MDGWELNKIAAAVVGTALGLGACWMIAVLVVPPDAPARPAIAIPGADGVSAPGVSPHAAREGALVAGVAPIAARLAVASAERGRHYAEAVCIACHTLERGAPVLVGPNLFGVAGGPVAAVADYDYSAALKRLGGRWTTSRLDAWLLRPQGFAPGTRMGFAGIADPARRADVVAFLFTLAAATPAPAPAAPAAPTEATDMAALVDRADPRAGEALAGAQCGACHVFDKDAAATIGPALWGVYGRAIGRQPDYAYSAVLSGHGGRWTVATLDPWLRDPRGFAPGTRMGFAGLADPAQRAAIIRYLRSLSDTP